MNASLISAKIGFSKRKIILNDNFSPLQNFICSSFKSTSIYLVLLWFWPFSCLNFLFYMWNCQIKPIFVSLPKPTPTSLGPQDTLPTDPNLAPRSCYWQSLCASLKPQVDPGCHLNSQTSRISSSILLGKMWGKEGGKGSGGFPPPRHRGQRGPYQNTRSTFSKAPHSTQEPYHHL